MSRAQGQAVDRLSSRAWNIEKAGRTIALTPNLIPPTTTLLSASFLSALQAAVHKLTPGTEVDRVM